MDLGAFSVNLAVKDIAASRAFYEALGFTTMGGDQDQGWLILRNGNARIGLFQGMFEKNLLTFNPGWDADAKTVEGFQDVRDIERLLQERGIPLVKTVGDSASGPGHLVLEDPDGNPILLDQHV
ncbi:MAG: VOC family protein [Planctomycetota bacterium]